MSNGNVCNLCEQRNLEVSALRISVDHLECEMARQRRCAEKEAAQWAVQLADAAAENRSLRLQLSRSSGIKSEGNAITAAGPHLGDVDLEGNCGNCRRLQQLVNVLQAKKNATSGVPPSQPDVIPALCDDRINNCEVAVQTAPINGMYFEISFLKFPQNLV